MSPTSISTWFASVNLEVHKATAMLQIIKNSVGGFSKVFSFSFDYKNVFLSLTILCEYSAKGRGQVWPGLSCPALVPLSTNDLVTSPLSPWRKCFSHADPSTPVQGCGGEHAACSVPCYQNSCWPALVNTGQNGDVDASEFHLEKRDWSKQTSTLCEFVEDDQLFPKLSVFAKSLHLLVLMFLF